MTQAPPNTKYKKSDLKEWLTEFACLWKERSYILKEILTDTYYKRGHVSCPSDTAPRKNISRNNDLLQAVKCELSETACFPRRRFSSLPTNACSTENNIPFPLFYLRGKWPINSCAIKCWQAKSDWKGDPRVTIFLFFFPSLKLCSAWKILKFD